MNDFAKPWRNHEVKSESANCYFGSETDTYLVLTLNKNVPELASPWGETLSSALVLDLEILIHSEIALTWCQKCADICFRFETNGHERISELAFCVGMRQLPDRVCTHSAECGIRLSQL